MPLGSGVQAQVKAVRVCLVGLMAWGHAAAEPRLEGRVLRNSGEPVARAQVRLFDLADLRGIPNAVTADESGNFTLHLGNSHEATGGRGTIVMDGLSELQSPSRQ